MSRDDGRICSAPQPRAFPVGNPSNPTAQKCVISGTGNGSPGRDPASGVVRSTARTIKARVAAYTRAKPVGTHILHLGHSHQHMLMPLQRSNVLLPRVWTSFFHKRTSTVVIFMVIMGLFNIIHPFYANSKDSYMGWDRHDHGKRGREPKNRRTQHASTRPS